MREYFLRAGGGEEALWNRELRISSPGAPLSLASGFWVGNDERDSVGAMDKV